MAISPITYSNTFSHWMITTNQLVTNINNLNTGNFFKNLGTLYLNSPNTGLYVANSSIFGGNVSISGTSGNFVDIQSPTLMYDTLSIFKNLSIVASGSITSNTVISSNSTVTNILTVNANAYFNSTNTFVRNIDGNTYQIISTKDLNDVNTTINNYIANTVELISSNISYSIANSEIKVYNYANNSFANTVAFANTVELISSNISYSIANSETKVYNYANNSFVKVTSNTVTIESFNSSNAVIQNLSVYGVFTNFGSTISDSNEFLFLANTGSISSVNTNIVINRSGGSSNNANAIIRWYNTGKEWQIRDIDNPTVFNKITTKNELDGANTFLYNYINGKIGGNSGDIIFGGDVTVSGNLTINGLTTTLNANTLSIDDKNITLGDVIVIANTPLIATSLSNGTIIGSTTGLIPGMTVTKISGAGTPASGAQIISIESPSQFTLSSNSQILGSFYGSINGASDTSANGGGITLKGTTNKTFNWVGGTANAWISSENLSLSQGKVIVLNGSSSGTTILQPSSVANGTLTLSSNSGTLISTGDIGTITNSMLAANAAGLTISNIDSVDYNHNLIFANSSSGLLTTAYVANTKLYFNPSTGSLNSTLFNSLSDIKFKTNISPIINAVEIVKQINAVEYDWKDNGKHCSGVIAQQLQEILPFLVEENIDGEKSVNYSGLIGYLIAAINELSSQVEELHK